VRIDEIRAGADQGPKVEPEFLIQIRDDENLVVAEVSKVLHVRRKNSGIHT
jgi:hypothetical protein